jgi:hypothetical protein
MASFAGISAAGMSVVRVLNAFFARPPVPVPGETTTAFLARTDDFERGNGGNFSFSVPALSIYVYRVDFNKTMRAAWAGIGSVDGRAHLPLDLHFLATPWGTNTQDDQAILGRAMECFEAVPILTGPLLHPGVAGREAGWSPSEGVQIVLEEISTEAVMRTFDSLPIDYRLSVPYIARIVRLDGQDIYPTRLVDELVTALQPRVP